MIDPRDGNMVIAFDAARALLLFKLATAAALAGVGNWFRKGSAEEDEMVADCHDMVLDTVSNADLVREIDLETGENVRDQITVEQALAMHEERELRRWGWGRN